MMSKWNILKLLEHAKTSGLGRRSRKRRFEYDNVDSIRLKRKPNVLSEMLPHTELGFRMFVGFIDCTLLSVGYPSNAGEGGFLPEANIEEMDVEFWAVEERKLIKKHKEKLILRRPVGDVGSCMTSFVQWYGCSRYLVIIDDTSQLEIYTDETLTLTTQIHLIPSFTTSSYYWSCETCQISSYNPVFHQTDQPATNNRQMIQHWSEHPMLKGICVSVLKRDKSGEFSYVCPIHGSQIILREEQNMEYLSYNNELQRYLGSPEQLILTNGTSIFSYIIREGTLTELMGWRKIDPLRNSCYMIGVAQNIDEHDSAMDEYGFIVKSSDGMLRLDCFAWEKIEHLLRDYPETKNLPCIEITHHALKFEPDGSSFKPFKQNEEKFQINAVYDYIEAKVLKAGLTVKPVMYSIGLLHVRLNRSIIGVVTIVCRTKEDYKLRSNKSIKDELRCIDVFFEWNAMTDEYKILEATEFISISQRFQCNSRDIEDCSCVLCTRIRSDFDLSGYLSESCEKIYKDRLEKYYPLNTTHNQIQHHLHTKNIISGGESLNDLQCRRGCCRIAL